MFGRRRVKGTTVSGDMLYAREPKSIGVGPLTLRISIRCTRCGYRSLRGLTRSSARRSVTLIQRFGSAVNLNIHLHCLVLDGVYQIKPNGELAFIQASAPTEQVLQLLLRAIITSIMKCLVRQGVLV
jgi:Putative transposase